MASIRDEDNMEKSCGGKESILSLKSIIPEAEFGLGICDPTYHPRTWSGMGKLFQQETLSDVMLMAEGQSIPCHKFLLAAASEYFYNRLVVETETDNLLEIEGITFNALQVIISYLYTGHINITAENITDVIPACKMLKLTSAYDLCETFALEVVNPGNCIGLCKIAIANNFQHLSAKALCVMENNFNAVVSGKEFIMMSETDLADYIQNESLKIPNDDPVFEAVKSWIRYKPQERESSFYRLIKHVRLRYCSPHYLTQVVSKEALMDNHECQKILVAALVHHTAATFTDSSKHPSTAPRKGYIRTSTLMTIGGVSDPGGISRTDCWCLGESGWSVMKRCPMPLSLFCFSACMTREGILVTGGSRGTKPVSQCWLLSTSTYQWRPLPDLNTSRERHASVCVAGKPHVIGGLGSDGKEMSSVECLQSCNKGWDTLPDLPIALVHTMAVSDEQHIYVFGGGHMKGDHFRSVFVYGENRKSWQTLADMPQGCMCGSAVLWKGKIYVVGGFEQSCMCYDPVLAQWSTLSQCGHEHANGPALVWNDRILVCGGRSRQNRRDDGKSGRTSVAEEYDPETDTWTVSQIELPQKLSLHFVFSTESCYVSEVKTDIPSSKQAFLIGDATIDGIHSIKTYEGNAVTVHMRPDATYSEISQELDRDEIIYSASEMFLVCGMKEAGNNQSLREIKPHLVGLVSKAKDLCDSLKVSSVLPSAIPNERTNQLNGLIRDVCMQVGVIFVDNDKNFLLGENTRDDVAFVGKKNRLSSKGKLRLMGNMGLVIPRLQKTM